MRVSETKVSETDLALGGGFDEVLLVGPLVRDEEPAMRALEACVPRGGAGEQLLPEGLAAVGARHLENGRLGGVLAHFTTVAERRMPQSGEALPASDLLTGVDMAAGDSTGSITAWRARPPGR